MSGLIKSGKRLIRGVKRASPYILTGTAVVGVGTTAVLAAKATPAAIDDLREAAANKVKETGDPEARLTKAEAVKVAAPHYIPAGISGLITSGCMLLSTHISMKRAAACASIATAAQTALSEYSGKVAEKFGKEKEQEVHDEIAVDKMKKNLPTSKGCILDTGEGDHLFFFIPHNVWFRSDRETIRRKVNDFNQERLVDGDPRPENDWLYLLYKGYDRNGEEFGFRPIDRNNMRMDDLLELRFTDYILESGDANTDYDPRFILNGEAATAIDYAPWSGPEANYSD